MSGLSPKILVDTSNEGGYTLNKTYRQVVKQNFKHLLLTEPGEKIMDKNFGVGLKKFLLSFIFFLYTLLYPFLHQYTMWLNLF